MKRSSRGGLGDNESRRWCPLKAINRSCLLLWACMLRGSLLLKSLRKGSTAHDCQSGQSSAHMWRMPSWEVVGTRPVSSWSGARELARLLTWKYHGNPSPLIHNLASLQNHISGDCRLEDAVQLLTTDVRKDRHIHPKWGLRGSDHRVDPHTGRV